MENRIASTHGVSRSLLAVTEQAERLEIGRYKLPELSTMTITVCAWHPDVRSYWYLYTHPVDAPVEIVVEDGCDLGARIDDVDGLESDAAEVVVAQELVFRRRPGVGETTTFRYRIEYCPRERDGAPEQDYFRRVVTSAACRRLRLDLAFSARALPPLVQRKVWDSRALEGRPLEIHPVVLSRTDRETWIDISAPAPAAHGWTWRW